MIDTTTCELCGGPRNHACAISVEFPVRTWDMLVCHECAVSEINRLDRLRKTRPVEDPDYNALFAYAEAHAHDPATAPTTYNPIPYSNPVAR